MPSLPQCAAYGYIYDQAGDPAANVLVTLMQVLDAQGNPILLTPKTTLTDSTGTYHFNLPQGATAYISARASTLWSCDGGVAHTVPMSDTGALAPQVTPLPPEGFSVQPPLSYVGGVLSLPRASASADGYLHHDDFAQFALGQPPGGITGDVQMNSAGAFAASLLRQVPNVSGAAALQSAGDVAVPAGFLTHNTITLMTPLTQNVTGAALATGLRIMDTDDGAGNAQWFELLGSYGAFNLQWQHTGSGAPSREFFIDNGRSRIVMHGFWRGNIDEGDQIALFTLDPSPHDSTNFQFLNGLVVSGEWHPMDTFGPGVYIKAHNNNASYGYAYGYQYYFDHDGLNLPGPPTASTHAITKAHADATYLALAGGTLTGALTLAADPTAPMHAATQQYVLAHAGSGGGGALPAGSGTEVQYRASGSAFGAVANSSVDGNGNVHVPQRFFVSGNSGMSAPPELHLSTGGAAGTAHLCIDDGMGSVTPFAAFAAYNDSSKPGQLYIGRSNWGTINPAMRISLWTSPTGIFANSDGTRRLHISANGNVTINTVNGSGGAPADNAYSCTIETGAAGHFPKALLVNGIGEMSADPTTPMGIATQQYVLAHAGGGGSAPGGSATELQYRASSSAFGAVAGSVVDGSGNVTIRGVEITSNAVQTLVGSGGAFSLNNFGADGSHYVQLQLNQAANGATFVNANPDGVDLVDFSFQVASTMALRLRAEMRSSICQPGGDFRFSTWGHSDVVIIGATGLQSGAPIYLAGGSGTSKVLDYDGTYWNLGPNDNGAGGFSGQYAVIRCGTGGYSAPGSVFVNGVLAQWNFYAQIRMAAGYTINIYDASTNSNPPILIGPAGSGPGGIGRALYV